MSTPAAPTAQKLRAQIWLAWGDTDGQTEQLANFVEAAATGNMIQRIKQNLTPNTSKQALNLASFCTTATYIVIRDLGGTGVNVALDTNATAPFQIAANGMMVYKNAAATPPTLYLTNPNGTYNAYVEVGLLGTQ